MEWHTFIAAAYLVVGVFRAPTVMTRFRAHASPDQLGELVAAAVLWLPLDVHAMWRSRMTRRRA